MNVKSLKAFCIMEVIACSMFTNIMIFILTFHLNFHILLANMTIISAMNG